MDSINIYEELREFIVRHFDIPADDPYFSDQVNLYDFGYIDSLGAADLLAFVEERFDLRIGELDWQSHRLNTIVDIAQFVAAKNGRVS